MATKVLNVHDSVMIAQITKVQKERRQHEEGEDRGDKKSADEDKE